MTQFILHVEKKRAFLWVTRERSLRQESRGFGYLDDNNNYLIRVNPLGVKYDLYSAKT